MNKVTEFDFESAINARNPHVAAERNSSSLELVYRGQRHGVIGYYTTLTHCVIGDEDTVSTVQQSLPNA
ncbi:hypothetical protein [Novipirellula galeiformis]|uniref:hypothetical protein n=1 Tax=Novipirellula galeiformis TaxID=2528004 RepID=UPI0011B68DA8|nr:hypothetical protein [Novipirellula galeiformis]